MNESNIKKSTSKVKAEFEALQDRVFEHLYARADEILKQYNPCQHQVKAGCYSCLAMRDKSDMRESRGCCQGCLFLTKTGCAAEKPLTCKTWLCHIAQITNPEAKKQLNYIANLVSSFNFYIGRGDKRMSLMQSSGHYYCPTLGKINYFIGLIHFKKLIKAHDIILTN